MDWYYARGNDQVGPVAEDELARLVRAGTIGADTLVWCETFEDWRPYGEAGPEFSGPEPRVRGESVFDQELESRRRACVECGQTFPEDEMVRYADSWVCAGCKPVFYQRVQEGAVLPGIFHYGGFWIRLVAEVIDLVILYIAMGIYTTLTVFILSPMEDPALRGLIFFFVVSAVGFVVQGAYNTWFVGRFGATPGKLALGLRIVRADGGRVTYARALARWLSEMISAITLYIGYIMAAFDSEKQALHDHICDTRVIYAR